MNEQTFRQDEKTQFAVLYAITILGEVVKRLSSNFRSDHPTIPWREIAGMRDKMVHDYQKVNIDLVWQVIQHDIPQLLAYITPLLPTEE